MWYARGNDNITTRNNTREIVDNIDGYKLFGMWDNPHAHRVFISGNVYRYSIPVILSERYNYFLFSVRIMSFSSLRDPSGRNRYCSVVILILHLRESTLSSLLKRYRIYRQIRCSRFPFHSFSITFIFIQQIYLIIMIKIKANPALSIVIKLFKWLFKILFKRIIGMIITIITCAFIFNFFFSRIFISIE